MKLEQLQNYKSRIQELARQYKIDPDSIRVFGSVARGDATETSDVDLLVRTLPGCGLLRLGGFYVALEDMLHCKVDIVTEDAISPYLRPSIMESAQFL